MPEPLIDYLKRYDDHPRLNTTMATKYPSLLTLDVSMFNKKPRVRVSVMPQVFSDILEPKMQSITSRIEDINRLKDLGWEVHINYSPVIFYPGWEELYDDLFAEIKIIAGENKCEVIALTNHILQMQRSNFLAQNLMKYSSEIKNNEGIMRYPLSYKTKWLDTFKYLYTQYFDLDTIRYIF